MDIKSVATTAKMVIESLVVLLDGEGVDIESIKMDINGGNQKLDFKKLIDLVVSELKLIRDGGNQVPEGFDDIQSWIAVNSFSALDAVHENVPIIDANELAKYIDSLIEAQEQSNV